MAIAKETARRLGMGFNIFTPEQLENAGQFHVSTTQLIEEADGFAQGRVRECGKGIECNAEEVWQGVSGGGGGGVNARAQLSLFVFISALPVAQSHSRFRCRLPDSLCRLSDACASVPRAQVQDREEAAKAQPHRGHDGRWRQ